MARPASPSPPDPDNGVPRQPASGHGGGARPHSMRRIGAALAALLVAALAIFRPEDVPAPYAPWQPLDPEAAPTLVTWVKLIRAGHDPVYCRAALAASRARAPAVPDRIDSAQCHIRDGVRLQALSAARLAPEAMRCELALRLYLWERHDLQTAARRLLGSRVAAIEHYGSYNCRQMRTGRGTSGRMSEHATANAFDISGFVLADGRRITLKSGWSGVDAEAAFLRAARDGLCARFRAVLGPDYNALHADHFHVDQGTFPACR